MWFGETGGEAKGKGAWVVLEGRAVIQRSRRQVTNRRLSVSTGDPRDDLQSGHESPGLYTGQWARFLGMELYTTYLSVAAYFTLRKEIRDCILPVWHGILGCTGF